MLKASYAPLRLDFAFRALTSRGELPAKDTWFIKLWDTDAPDTSGIGECAMFAGLSAEDTPGFASVVEAACRGINSGEGFDSSRYSSLRFAFESALLDLQNGGNRTLFPGSFAEGKSAIVINGLVWMGTQEEMLGRVEEKIAAGFNCIKFKIGGLDFEKELQMLDKVRLAHGPKELTIRLDANGAFTEADAETKLRRLSVLDIHSIEQPVKPGQWDLMSYLCENSPIAVALDEELIGVHSPQEIHKMLYYIKPAYIILKPSLCGGFSGATDWLAEAERQDIGWWVTSALESNVGLNAIAQWTSSLGVEMPQGLGTGKVFVNNIPSPLRLDGEKLSYDGSVAWDFSALRWITPE